MRRPSTESTGSARRQSYGWSRSAVTQEEEEEVEKRKLIVLPDAHVLGEPSICRKGRFTLASTFGLNRMCILRDRRSLVRGLR